jgi:anti-sigma regulatory factor (Ser/Thr protein kinase)
VPGDQIQLELPASPEYGRVARIAAAHLALRRGFSLDEIDDLRLVMDEVAVMLLSNGRGDDRLDITYSVGDDTVGVDARIVSDRDDPLPIEQVRRFAELVGELIDEYTIDRVGRRLTLTKTRVS